MWNDQKQPDPPGEPDLPVHGGDQGEEHVEGEAGQEHPRHLVVVVMMMRRRMMMMMMMMRRRRMKITVITIIMVVGNMKLSRNISCSAVMSESKMDLQSEFGGGGAIIIKIWIDNRENKEKLARASKFQPSHYIGIWIEANPKNLSWAVLFLLSLK